MPKIAYQDHNFRIESRAHIFKANEIIDMERKRGLTLTVRQIYYKFVKEKIIPNNVKAYDNLQALLNNARLAGLIDWNAIEDRTRSLNSYGFSDLPAPLDVLRSTHEYHEVDRWADQEFYVEVWVEKDALIGVIEKACQPLRVPHFACKGYNSQSEQWRAGQRFIGKINDEGKSVVVIHLGDHDPSGINMTKDNHDRLTEFINYEADSFDKFAFKRIALNMDQIKEYDLPPDPAKQKDVRYRDYAKKYGDGSWELDALDSMLMVNLIQSEIKKIIEPLAWKKSGEREDAEKKVFKDAMSLLENPPPRDPPPCPKCSKPKRSAKKKPAKPRNKKK